MFGKLFKNRAAEKKRTEQWEKERKEWEEAREALRTDISAQLSGTSYADEILKVLDIRPNSVHFWHSGANLKQENDGTWSLTRYYNLISKCWDQETGLAQQDAIGKLIAFVRDWQAGNYPQGSFNAMKERYKNDEIGMGKLLFEWYSRYSTICISEIAVPACLNVYEQMAGIHDESETCIDLFDANGHKVESLAIREPEGYVISGVSRSEDELIVAYLKKALNISDE